MSTTKLTEHSSTPPSGSSSRSLPGNHCRFKAVHPRVLKVLADQNPPSAAQVVKDPQQPLCGYLSEIYRYRKLSQLQTPQSLCRFRKDPKVLSLDLHSSSILKRRMLPS